MSIELRLLCAVLATWRLTHLLTAEDGPADFVVRIRAQLGDTIAGRAMDCFYCLSVWIAAPIALFVSTDPMTWLVTWVAVSGAACLLERATTRADDQTSIRRVDRAGVSYELLWPPASGAEADDRAASAAEARIAGTIGIDPPWIPR